MTTLETVLAEQNPSLEMIASFVKSNRFPIVQGTKITFAYVGAADRVRLRHFIFGLPSVPAFRRAGHSELWTHTLEVPVCSRFEYKIEVVHAERSEWILDPLNPSKAHDPFGANSVCHSSGYVVPDWVEERVETRKGSMDSLTIKSRAFGDERALRVYLPSRFRRRARYPLLGVHDGDDYLMFSRMMTVLDNLTHRLEIPSMIVALTNPRDRLVEYADSERHARHLVEEIVPAMEENFPLVGTPSSRGLMGASFGAVASLAAAWRYPKFFGKLMLQSGSFGFTDIGEHQRGPVFDPVVRFVNAFRERPGQPADRLFVSCGTYESLIYENRSMVPLLQATGMDVRYVEARDGHCWENWRDRMREGLSWLFPGPLWMVYE